MAYQAFDPKFLRGLFFFLVMIHLSMHRTVFDRTALIEFFRGKPEVHNVIQIMKSNKPTRDQNIEPPTPGVFGNKTSLFRMLFRKTNYLKEDEIDCLILNLKRFSKHLEGEELLSDEDAFEVRISLAVISEIIGFRIRWSSGSFFGRVEHANQSEHLECQSIEELVGGPWPGETDHGVGA